VTGYIQAQFVDDERSRDELAGSGTRNLDQFSIRRGRVKFTYQATPTSKFVIQPDITSSGVVLATVTSSSPSRGRCGSTR
jgi:hypothetical protein